MVGLRVNTRLGDDRSDEATWCDVESGIVGWAVVGRDLDSLDVGDLFRASFLDRNSGSIGQRRVEGGGRSGDVERDLMVASQHREHVGADLVGGVAVAGDAVGSCYDAIDFALLHEPSSGSVADGMERDVVVKKFERG